MNEYLFIKPSEFWKYDYVDIDGNYPHVSIFDFDVAEDKSLNKKFNLLVFEISTKESIFSKGTKKYGKYATEVITNTKFDVTIEEDPETKEEMITLKNDEYGLYLSKPLNYNSIHVKASEANGRLKALQNNPEMYATYCRLLESMYQSAKYYKDEHDSTVYKVETGFKHELKRNFFRSLKDYPEDSSEE